ncbi:hypothetical protein B0H11DRAFT_1967255 [Mycena galericulata]|nr:hypothetical protein B0H11DRAFT_1967255 [Mycena galericulata]
MPSNQVPVPPLTKCIQQANSSTVQSIEVASSTVSVPARGRTMGGTYQAHSRLNVQDEVSEHNGSSNFVAFQNHISSSNEVDDDAPKRNFFQPLSHRATQSKPADVGTLWANIAPAMEKVQSIKSVKDQPQGSTQAAAQWATVQDGQPLTHVDDNFRESYRWTLGDDIQAILDDSKSNASNDTHKTSAPPRLVADNHKTSKEPTTNTLSKSSLSNSSYTSQSPPTRTKPTRTPPSLKDKTVFTSPSPSPSVISDDYFRVTPNLPDLRRTPSTPATTAPSSPAFTDVSNSRGRSWMYFDEIKREDSPDAPLPFSPITTEASREYSPATDGGSSHRAWSADALREYSPAAEPPLSPVTDAGSVRSKGREYSPLAERSLSPDVNYTNSAHASSEDTTGRGRTSHCGGLSDNPLAQSNKAVIPPEDLFAPSVVAEPSNATRKVPRVIERRQVEELRALIPQGKKAPKKRVYNKKPVAQQEAIRVPNVHAVALPPSSAVSTAKSTPSIAGVKRARQASPSRHLYAPPVKRQATQAKAVRINKPSVVTLINWTNELVRLEELAYQGKQGPGEVQQVVKLLKALLAGAEGVTFKWVQEAVRTRSTTSGEERKDKPHLVQEIVTSYAAFDDEGEVTQLAAELFKKWRALGSNEYLAWRPGFDRVPIPLSFVVVHGRKGRVNNHQVPRITDSSFGRSAVVLPLYFRSLRLPQLHL